MYTDHDCPADDWQSRLSERLGRCLHHIQAERHELQGMFFGGNHRSHASTEALDAELLDMIANVHELELELLAGMLRAMFMVRQKHSRWFDLRTAVFERIRRDRGHEHATRMLRGLL